MYFIGRLRQKTYLTGPDTWAWLGGCLIALMTAAVAQAAPEPVEAASAPETTIPQLVNSPLQPLDYGDRTDYQLTELGARWDDLSRPEREALLREVKLRMAQRKDADGVLMIRTQRRYGRIYRSNGRYIKIETKVVRVRPGTVDPGRQPNEFGVGFEQRTASADNSEASNPTDGVAEADAAAERPPVVRVNGSSQ
jgi:hypothetical protein